ncbi:MAG TPA: hypothetical protein VIA98_10755 [Allosphingosinicella sp.]
MATHAPAAPPAWFRIVAVLAILWNAFGVFQYLTTTGLFGDTLAASQTPSAPPPKPCPTGSTSPSPSAFSPAWSAA